MAFELNSHRPGGALYGVDDRDVGSTAAQMRRGRRIGESVFDLRHSRIRVSGEQIHGGNHHSALAKAALRHLFIDPRLLDRVQALGALNPFCAAQTPGNPSIVVTRLPTTEETGVMHERTSLPSTSTAQAPHCASPQPKRGPVNPRVLRRT